MIIPSSYLQPKALTNATSSTLLGKRPAKRDNRTTLDVESNCE